MRAVQNPTNHTANATPAPATKNSSPAKPTGLSFPVNVDSNIAAPNTNESIGHASRPARNTNRIPTTDCRTVKKQVANQSTVMPISGSVISTAVLI